MPRVGSLPASSSSGAKWVLRPAIPSPLPPPAAVTYLVRSLVSQPNKCVRVDSKSLHTSKHPFNTVVKPSKCPRFTFQHARHTLLACYLFDYCTNSVELQRFRAIVGFNSDLFKLSSRNSSDVPQHSALDPALQEAWEACACATRRFCLQQLRLGGRGRERV